MAISGFGRSKEDSSGAAPTPSSSGSGAGNLSAFIDQGSNFEGKLSFKDTVRIDGGFKGEISSENTLIVGESGEIEYTPTLGAQNRFTAIATDNHGALSDEYWKTIHTYLGPKIRIQSPYIDAVFAEGAPVPVSAIVQSLTPIKSLIMKHV